MKSIRHYAGLLALLLLSLAQPVLQAQTVSIRTAPRPQGNYTPMVPQRAYNTLLVSRLPKNWTVPTNRYLFWQGPTLASPTERTRLFTNGGITHMMKTAVSNAMNLPAAKRGTFPGGDGIHQLAISIANSLPSTDSRKATLLLYGNQTSGHYYVNYDMSAYALLGAAAYEQEVAANSNIPPDVYGTDLEDHESAPGFPGADHYFINGFYQGVKNAIAARNATTKIYTYGSASLAAVVNHTNNRQDSDKAFRDPGDYWIDPATGRFSVTLPQTAVFRSGALVGGDKYARRTWDNATLFQKNGDGTIKTDNNGNALWYYGARTNVSNYGQTFSTYRYESVYFNNMWYSEADKLLTEWRWLCNTPITGYAGNFVNMPFPRGTTDIRPGLQNIRLISYFRNNTEIEEMYDPITGTSDPLYATPEMGIEAANARALNPDATEFTCLARTVLNHALFIWTAEGNYIDWVNGAANQHPFNFTGQGGNGTNYAPKQRFGQLETMLKGSYRGRNFPQLFTVMDAGKADFILPWRFVVNGNVSAPERETDKPIFWGIHEHGGRRMWAFWCLPAQDVGNSAMDRVLTMWIELPNGAKSPSYSMLCKDRKTGYDQILLPAGFESATAEDFRFKFTGLLGGTYYRTGNYNVSVSGTPAVPAPASSTVTMYTLPTSAQ